MIEFEAKIEKFDFNHWQHHVHFPEHFLVEIESENKGRIIAWFDGLGPYHLAVFKAKTHPYILVNQQIRNKLKKDAGDLISVKVEIDHSEFGHDVPEKFSVLLDQDEEAAEYFNSLTKGKQRSLIYIVTKVKNPESRMKKSLAIMHHLRLSKGALDYKQLNELIKYYNNL
ncbi:YdeI/OmpD-associated family protein [Algoriphagus namhaensis]|uniref:YdeI/OmpD-associated family protein n=1 Tax=Algoriphagus namhaensis TaxID=915353 RepID=A0ABV8ATT6_9BACT